MNETHNIPEVDAEIPANAVSVYGQSDALEDFPVLKAFQQYVDAEQAKARKRLLMICSFFGVLMFVVIAVFVGMLVTISNRNQALNDRLIEFAMNNRAHSSGGSPVVVQPPQDSAAILALTAKLDEMQKKLADDQAKAEKAAAEAAEEAKKAAIDAAKPKPPSAAELEVKRLKALLAAEKEKASAERERQRQEELEAYRRKHYPELYEQRKPRVRRTISRELTDEELDDIVLEDDDAIEYFDEEDEDDYEPREIVRPRIQKKVRTIPVDVKRSSTPSNGWQIPEE